MTYCIVARDAGEGHMGIATQSQAFSVGSSVSWAAPGHGVVATQSLGEPMYGELGLAGLTAGLTAQQALTALNSVDPHPERRQVAMVDGHGNVAAYTGEACVAAAGHCVGDGCAALGNLVSSPRVWTAMLEAFELTLNGYTAEALAALPDEEVDPATDPDLTWWRAIVLANAGEETAAVGLSQALMSAAPGYVEAARRFGAAGLMDQALIDRLLPRQ
jgi:uncharacterized Ntn-hydrolase superfamily protein